IKDYRRRFTAHDFPKFDIIGITTLFTFCWKETIDTINSAKNFCSPSGKILVGGIAASLVPQEILRETGITPIIGTLNRPGMIDPKNPDIIDSLPLDYSILEETDYTYPAHDAYFAYTTRGCIRQCDFCAVPILEPEYRDFLSISRQISYIDEHFGQRKDLLLMDNNVLASPRFDDIIDEIKACGFAKGASYIPPDEYAIAFRNLTQGLNTRAYIIKILKLYDKLAGRLSGKDAGDFYNYRESHGLLYPESATPEEIIRADSYFRPLYSKHFRPVKRSRYVDFNQGIDARLITDSNMQRLSEINIRPLRIAFDHYEQRDIYTSAVRLAAKWGISDLSNYLLYNFHDKPDDLYMRMRINVDLCEELDVKIYSFPMKYHPVRDPEYFRNRDYIGTHWNRKFIRAIQAVMNSTKGKIGRGVAFFEAAFGRDIHQFHDILYMPETFIIYREKYSTLAEEWQAKFYALSESDMKTAKSIIESNNFGNTGEVSEELRDVLSYYLIER
ncbi:MAG: hypothetical protein IJU26_00515, partial [Synergistaceae bacterium]|nr:hypothetical protein [Synergistaceae bacterium]